MEFFSSMQVWVVVEDFEEGGSSELGRKMKCRECWDL